MNNNIEIGARIRQKRKEKKLTQSEAAELAGISRSYLGDVENARYSASVEALTKIAHAVDSSLSFILTGKNDFSDLSLTDQVRLRNELADVINKKPNNNLIFLKEFFDQLEDDKWTKQTINLLASSLNYSFNNSLDDKNSDPVKIRFLIGLIDGIVSFQNKTLELSEDEFLNRCLDYIKFITNEN